MVFVCGPPIQIHFKLHSNSLQAPLKLTSSSTQTHFKLHSNSLQAPLKLTSSSIQTHFKLHSNSLQALLKHTSSSIQTHFKLHSNSLQAPLMGIHSWGSTHGDPVACRGGLDQSDEEEDTDRADFQLPGVQIDLIHQLAAIAASRKVGKVGPYTVGFRDAVSNKCPRGKP